MATSPPCLYKQGVHGQTRLAIRASSDIVKWAWACPPNPGIPLAHARGPFARGTLIHTKRHGLGAGDVGGLEGDAEGDAAAVGAFGGDAVLVDDALDGHDAFDQLFGARRAAGDVDVDGDELVAALDDGVGVEDAAGAGAGAHGDDPLGLGHLLVDALEDGHGLDADAAGDDEEV